MKITVISLMILLLGGTIIALNIYKGKDTRLDKLFISILTLIVSIFSGIFLARYFVEKTGAELYWFHSCSPNAMGRMLDSVVLKAFLFTLFCFISWGLLTLIYRGVYKNKNYDSKNEFEYKTESVTFMQRKNKIYGSIMGAIIGVLITIIIFTPIIGTLRSLENLSCAFSNDDDAREYGIDKSFLGDIDKFSNDLFGNIILICGGEFIFDSVAVFKNGDKSVSLNKEIKSIKPAIDLRERLHTYSYIDKDNAVEILDILSQFDDTSMADSLLLENVDALCQVWRNSKIYASDNDRFLIEPFVTTMMNHAINNSYRLTKKDVKLIVEIISKLDYLVDSGRFGYSKSSTIVDSNGKLGEIGLLNQKMKNSDVFQDIADVIYDIFVRDGINKIVKQMNSDTYDWFMNGLTMACRDASRLDRDVQGKIIADYIFKEVSPAYFAEKAFPKQYAELISKKILNNIWNMSWVTDSEIKWLFNVYCK